jgi:hypothetical protein
MTQRQYQEVSKNIKEFCVENHIHYDDIPFDKKFIALKGNLNTIKIDWRLGFCTLFVNRDNILEESMIQFAFIDPFKELKIHFIGEISNDAGGLIREWFTVISKAILSLGLFERANSDNFAYKIKSHLKITEKNLSYFRFIGVIMAKALLENVTINTCFSLIIYKMLLGENISLKDIEIYDDQVGKFMK